MKEFFINQNNSNENDFTSKVAFRFFMYELFIQSQKGYNPKQCYHIALSLTLKFFDEDFNKSHLTFRTQKEAFYDLLEAFHVGSYFYEINSPTGKCVIIHHASDNYPIVC